MDPPNFLNPLVFQQLFAAMGTTPNAFLHSFFTCMGGPQAIMSFLLAYMGGPNQIIPILVLYMGGADKALELLFKHLNGPGAVIDSLLSLISADELMASLLSRMGAKRVVELLLTYTGGQGTIPNLLISRMGGTQAVEHRLLRLLGKKPDILKKMVCILLTEQPLLKSAREEPLYSVRVPLKPSDVKRLKAEDPKTLSMTIKRARPELDEALRAVEIRGTTLMLHPASREASEQIESEAKDIQSALSIKEQQEVRKDQFLVASRSFKRYKDMYPDLDNRAIIERWEKQNGINIRYAYWKTEGKKQKLLVVSVVSRDDQQKFFSQIIKFDGYLFKDPK